MSANEWQLDELLAMFPDVSRGTRRVLRCLWRTSGEGRCLKQEAGFKRAATVSLVASPATQFLLRLVNEWPKGLGVAARRAVESELLQGILEGTISCEDPPWQCRLDCTVVEWFPQEHGSSLVRLAALAAVQDLVQGGAWEAIGGPGDHVA